MAHLKIKCQVMTEREQSQKNVIFATKKEFFGEILSSIVT